MKRRSSFAGSLFVLKEERGGKEQTKLRKKKGWKRGREERKIERRRKKRMKRRGRTKDRKGKEDRIKGEDKDRKCKEVKNELAQVSPLFISTKNCHLKVTNAQETREASAKKRGK